jgi:hypothetical protein
MRSATPRPPKRHRYTPRPAQTLPGRYTPGTPDRAGLPCYAIAVSGRAGAAGLPLGAAAGRPWPGRYTTAGAAPWQ